MKSLPLRLMRPLPQYNNHALSDEYSVEAQ
nr:MAG TPA: hypothetical protein [Bacteriophage sp.]